MFTLTRRDLQTWFRLAVVFCVLAASAFLFVPAPKLARAAAPTGTTAELQDAFDPTKVTMAVTVTDFSTFVGSGTGTAGAGDLANISYAAKNPVSAVWVSATQLNADFLVSDIGTAKSGGSLTIAADTIQDGSSVHNALITIADGSITDTANPRLASFTSTTADGTYGPTSGINVTATFSEVIAAGSMTVDLNNGVTGLVLSTISTNTLSGTYTVGATGSGETKTGL
ncbi:MAG TPA: hypothetical protein VLC10_05075, partial [Patescibacteria group bacterium]|nr:hypothetical protein [Patescibacteria group bacterium]